MASQLWIGLFGHSQKSAVFSAADILNAPVFSPMIILFLDLDGVLRRVESEKYKLEADLVENLRILLRSVPGISVVITSSWREVWGLASLKQHFPPEVRAKIVGVTPTSSSLAGHVRHREVLAYLEKFHTVEHKWLAVDDEREHFPLAAPLFLVDPSKGLDTTAAAKLQKQLQILSE